LLNHAADHFAGRAAMAEELGMQFASNLLYYGKLVGKIQRRIVRIIVSHVEKATYERKVFMPKPSGPTLDDLIESTSHNLQVGKKELRCVDCSGVVSKASLNVRNWLKAKCLATPYDDTKTLVPIPSWHTIQLGKSIVHSSHRMFAFKGVFICEACGAFGGQKCVKLATFCSLHATVAGQRAFDRMREGNTPSSLMVWPRLTTGKVWQAPSDSGHQERARENPISHFDDPDFLLPEDKTS
jgi:hypothetical protein